jgi:uncharacterized membrane protein
MLEAMYLTLSELAFLGMLMYLVAGIYFRITQKNVFVGRGYKKSSREYARVVKLFSTPRLILGVFALILVSANLVGDIYRLLNFRNQGAGLFLLVITTLVIILTIPVGANSSWDILKDADFLEDK